MLQEQAIEKEVRKLKNLIFDQNNSDFNSALQSVKDHQPADVHPLDILLQLIFWGKYFRWGGGF